MNADMTCETKDTPEEILEQKDDMSAPVDSDNVHIDDNEVISFENGKYVVVWDTIGVKNITVGLNMNTLFFIIMVIILLFVALAGVLFYLFSQKQIIKGVIAGAVKG